LCVLAGNGPATRLGALGGSSILIAMVVGYFIAVIGNLGVLRLSTPVKSAKTTALTQSTGKGPNSSDGTITRYSKPAGGRAADEKTVAISIAKASALAVPSYATEGVFKISTDAEGANLTVDGVRMKRQKGGWGIKGLVGSHTFVISAEGYETQKWAMTLLRGQKLRKFVSLKKHAALASLLITDGTPGADVYVDGKLVGQIDANGRLEVRVTVGKHAVEMAKPNYKSSVMKDIPVSRQVLYPNAALAPTRP